MVPHIELEVLEHALDVIRVLLLESNAWIFFQALKQVLAEWNTSFGAQLLCKQDLSPRFLVFTMFWGTWDVESRR